jgi:hypothetical protein
MWQVGSLFVPVFIVGTFIYLPYLIIKELIHKFRDDDN